MNVPPVYFYLPAQFWPKEGFPQNPDVFWQDFGRYMTGGVYCATIQTWQRLKAAGFPCELTGNLPSEGIIISHRNYLPDDLHPTKRQLFVCLKWDRSVHYYSQVHVVLNPKDSLPKRLLFAPFFKSHFKYIPHWPQPGLIPRLSSRRDTFENVAFVGNDENCAPELKSPQWPETIKRLGLNWQFVGTDRKEQWNDFSKIDLIVAVRKFTTRSPRFVNKPALKLYNAWHAGVPAIIGSDYPCRRERRSRLDYIEVTSLEDLIAAIKKLQQNSKLRRDMMENGKLRARETAPETITQIWIDFIKHCCAPRFENWCRLTPHAQKRSHGKSTWALRLNRMWTGLKLKRT